MNDPAKFRVTILIIHELLGLQTQEKNFWATCILENVMKKDECKPLWDFSINTNKMIEAKLIDMIRIKKGKKKCLKIDTVIPGAQNIFHKEQEKVDKYQDPSVEVHKMWNVKGTIIFVIINTLGTVSNSLGKLLAEIGITKDISSPEDLIA